MQCHTGALSKARYVGRVGSMGVYGGGGGGREKATCRHRHAKTPVLLASHPTALPPHPFIHKKAWMGLRHKKQRRTLCYQSRHRFESSGQVGTTHETCMHACTRGRGRPLSPCRNEMGGGGGTAGGGEYLQTRQPLAASKKFHTKPCGGTRGGGWELQPWLIFLDVWLEQTDRARVPCIHVAVWSDNDVSERACSSGHSHSYHPMAHTGATTTQPVMTDWLAGSV